MKIVYICQVFETGNDPGSDRHFYFSKHAVQSGHEMIGITSNVDYKKARIRKECKQGVKTRVVEDVTIKYVYSYPNFRGSFFKRFLYYITFFFSGIFEAVKTPDIDVIYAVSTPPTVGFMGALVSIVKRKPFIFEVTDVWPDAALACGVVKHPFLLFAARKMERFCYCRADHIIGLTSGICDNIIRKGIPENKISLVTNGVDESLYNNTSINDDTIHDLKESLNIESNQVVAMYLGAHGKYNSLHTIIDAALRLRKNESIVFVFIGDGDEKKNLIQRVETEHLENVIFLDPVPRAVAAHYLGIADMFLLPNRKGDFFKCNLPNKLFDFCASARPVIVAGEGESASLVETAECGLVVPPEDVNQFTSAIEKIAALTASERTKMGLKGRDHVFKNFNRKKLCDKQLKILKKCTTKPASKDTE